ncbi:MAG: FAD-binding oxidoreductase [Xanthomonadales bacterium]|nr:FAD-binding oxidoreductase [Xanthomonadales bacterium]
MTPGSPRCLVVGAGIVGACCAWHLQRKGARVTLIDPLSPGQSTSYGNAGCISRTSIFPFSYPGIVRKLPGWLLRRDGPVRIRWSQLATVAPWLYRFWRAGSPQRVREIIAAQFALMATVTEDYNLMLQATHSEFLRESRGLILIYDSQKDFAADAWKYELRDRLDIRWQKMSREEATAMEPQLRLRQGAAMFEPDWQHVTDPADLVKRFADAAIALGAQWLQDRVVAVSADGAAVSVTTESGVEAQADWLVVAAGAWSNRLIGQLGHQVPMIPKRGYHVMLQKPGVQLSHPIMSASRHVLLTPMSAGLRIAGTAEFAALDSPPDYRRAKMLVEKARHYMPGLEHSEMTEWMGQRPMMSDSIPVLGALPESPRVLCAFGHGHYGLTQGPTTGRIIASLVCGEDPGLDLTPFSISRFARRRAA